MELAELLIKKGNIFDHVLYEIQMYIETYIRLLKHIQEQNTDVILKNMILESHAVHLRNMIEFFNREQECITTDTIFSGKVDLSFNDTEMKAKQTINKTIGHLTKERYTWNQTERDLTVSYALTLHRMFREIMTPRIVSCVKMLCQEKEVKPELISQLKNDTIQHRLHELAVFCFSYRPDRYDIRIPDDYCTTE